MVLALPAGSARKRCADVRARHHSGVRSGRRRRRLQPREFDQGRAPVGARRDRARNGEARADIDPEPAADADHRLFPGDVQPRGGQEPHHHAGLHHVRRNAVDGRGIGQDGHRVHEAHGLCEPRHRELVHGEMGQQPPARRAGARQHGIDGRRRQDGGDADGREEFADPVEECRDRERRRLRIDHSVQQGRQYRQEQLQSDPYPLGPVGRREWERQRLLRQHLLQRHALDGERFGLRQRRQLQQSDQRHLLPGDTLQLERLDVHQRRKLHQSQHLERLRHRSRSGLRHDQYGAVDRNAGDLVPGRAVPRLSRAS